MTDKNTVRLNYTRRLHDNILNWYRNADTKAQVILAIDGGFIAFVSGTAFARPADLISIVEKFNTGTWIFIVLMIFTLSGSIGASIYCLWSRIYSEQELRKIIGKATLAYSSETGNSNSYAPSVTNFFQFIERMDVNKLETTLKAVDEDYELAALTSQIHILSGNVRVKHLAVNAGFILTSIALLMFFLVAGSYMFAVV